ncbi:hypothetical protein [Paracoccus sediminicola]|uniref:hypothetical protein n=1 Tax=Paracoccus sediminicola TaxID=3017783 RepID=UPI0022F14321|nr:hypothetical protein [Paracoccus sediminicola]WBU58590.1 hypothetical protein PAF18_15945 [Paracoccus sediminicola]
MMIFVFLVGTAVALLGLWLTWKSPNETKAPKYIAVIGLVMMCIPLADWLLTDGQGHGATSTGYDECIADGGSWLGGSCMPMVGSD